MEKKQYKYSGFGKHLKKVRKLNYSDIKEFSKITGIPLKLMYEYERGRTFPPIEKFITICKVLDKSPTYMLTPLLDMNQYERDLLLLYQDTDVREMLQDPELSNILKFTLIGYQILYQTRKHFNTKGDVVDYLNFVKEKLFSEGQLKRLK
jgi:transcriptional regulator with XRE-family HTH domain